jgi:trigger factor
VQVTVEKLGSCQAKITFVVPSQDYHGAVQAQLKERAASANLKGFRPGKVPVQVIEKQFGPQVRSETIEKFVQQAFHEAVQQHSLKVVGFQKVNLDELVNLPHGTDLSTGFEVSLRPEITLGNYIGLTITNELTPVTEQEIEQAIQNVKVQNSHPEAAGDEGLPENGIALAKIEWLVNGETVLNADGHRVTPAQPTPGVDEAAWKAAIVGAKNGDVREVAMTVPDTFNKEEHRGKAGLTRVTVKEAYKLVPPSDEDIHKMANVDSDAALKDFVKQQLTQQKELQEMNRAETALLQILIESHAFDLPQMMVQEQARSRLMQMEQQLRQQQAPEEVVRQQVEANRDASLKAAEHGLRALFLVQAVGEKEQLLVTKEDMEAELRSIAARNNAKLEEVGKWYQENNGFDQLAIEILERKVRKFLGEKATVKTA